MLKEVPGVLGVDCDPVEVSLTRRRAKCCVEGICPDLLPAPIDRFRVLTVTGEGEEQHPLPDRRGRAGYEMNAGVEVSPEHLDQSPRRGLGQLQNGEVVVLLPREAFEHRLVQSPLGREVLVQERFRNSGRLGDLASAGAVESFRREGRRRCFEDGAAPIRLFQSLGRHDSLISVYLLTIEVQPRCAMRTPLFIAAGSECRRRARSNMDQVGYAELTLEVIE